MGSLCLSPPQVVLHGWASMGRTRSDADTARTTWVYGFSRTCNVLDMTCGFVAPRLSQVTSGGRQSRLGEPGLPWLGDRDGSAVHSPDRLAACSHASEEGKDEPGGVSVVQDTCGMRS